MNTTTLIRLAKVLTCLVIAGGFGAAPAFAHCDALDGPVVKSARRALVDRNVNLVLIWVQKENEPEIRQAFEHAIAVRKLGAEARLLADRFFFETLVRVHRAGEGAPYTGLKPAGRDPGPAITLGDKAIETGRLDPVVELLSEAMKNGLRERFHAVQRKTAFAPNEIAAGREYVKAYVAYIHFVEGVYDAATSPVHAHPAESEEAHRPAEHPSH